MAGSVNKHILVGHLGKDPERRDFANGGCVVTFSLATSEQWKDKTTGEKKEATAWHQVAIFNENLAKVAMDYLKKGSQVYLEGEVLTRQWDKDGETRYTTETVLRGFNSRLVMVGGTGGNRPPPPDGDSYASRPATPRDLDDEVPF